MFWELADGMMAYASINAHTNACGHGIQQKSTTFKNPMTGYSSFWWATTTLATVPSSIFFFTLNRRGQTMVQSS